MSRIWAVRVSELHYPEPGRPWSRRSVGTDQFASILVNATYSMTDRARPRESRAGCTLGWALRRMGNRWLSIYLRDHHAASAGGVALARRALGRNHPVARQIAQDRETLEGVMRQLNVRPSPTKVGLVRMAERLGRLKLNGRLLKRSPLSRVIELEVLVVGIRGKEALWAALLRADRDIQGVDLGALIESAKTQSREVDQQRLRAVADAFGSRRVR
jgi:hypothetical protein